MSTGTLAYRSSSERHQRQTFGGCPRLPHPHCAAAADDNVSAIVATAAPVPLHTLPTWVDICAMSINAAFGAAVARNRRLTLLAVLIAGAIVGLGGGMVHDVLLGLEAAAIENWYYLPAVLGAALVGGFLAHRLIQGHTSYLVMHGVAIALLVTVGVQKALEYKTPGDAGHFPRGPDRDHGRSGGGCDGR